MAKEYKNVFLPYKLKNGDVLKNRIIYPNAQQTMIAGPEKAPTEGMIDDLAEFCYSGASLMCFGQLDKLGGGAVPTKHTGRLIMYPSFDYSDPRTFNYLAQTAEVAHMYGTKLLIKLAPAWPEGTTYYGGDEESLFPQPDDIRFRMPMEGTVERKRPKLTMEQMKARVCPKEKFPEVIQELVDMCLQYKKAGWDGMSFRSDRFLDASTNIREDEYNGEIENRGRFQLELFQAIKRACGEDFLIEVAMMGDAQYGNDGKIPHGYTTEEFVRFIHLVKDVVDIVEVRERNGVGYQCCGYNSQLHVHPTLEYAKALRDSGYTGTIAVNGGYNDPEEMEEILGQGVVDLISTGRTFRAEPRFVQKLRSGGKEVPVPCLRCNKCHGMPSGEPLAYCSVNPEVGMLHHLPAVIKPVAREKKVAIIGGGPIGMRTACYAAERGHKVTLFEKSGFLGGKMKYAAMYPNLWPQERYRAWLVDEVARRGVEVRMNTEPTPEKLAAEGFEAVIACTGSSEKRPPIEGADAAGVLVSEDIYESRVAVDEIGRKVVFVGGGAVATETAMYLAGLGKDVTVLTRQHALMQSQAGPHGVHKQWELIIPELGYGNVASAWAIYDNLTPVYEVTTTKVAPNAVTYVDREGNETTIEADTVIVSGGYQPHTDEALRYADCTREFYLAGDCDKRNNDLRRGNFSGYGKAMLL